MGVYIKGMEMPKSCCECAIKSWDGEDDVCPFSGISALSIGRQDDCPLIPVPPHGRLIDGDAFLALINDSTILSDFLKCIINPLIRGEPTVIEAEEGER